MEYSAQAPVTPPPIAMTTTLAPASLRLPTLKRASRIAALTILLAAALPGPAIGQSSPEPRPGAELIAKLRAAAENKSDAEKSDFYVSNLAGFERTIARFTALVAELPDIQRQSLAAGTRPFPDVPHTLTKTDFVNKFLYNASTLDPADRPAYFQLLSLNLAASLARMKAARADLEATAQSHDPALIPRAGAAAAASARIEAIIDEYRQTGSPALIASAESLASLPSHRDMIAKAQLAPPAARPAAPAPAVPTPAACRDNGDGTLTGTDGTIWQLCLHGQTYKDGECAGKPVNLDWYQAMDAARDNRFLGHKDWILPSTAFTNGSLHPKKCLHPNLEMHMKNINPAVSLPRIGRALWAANTHRSGRYTRVTDAEQIAGTAEVYVDSSKATSFPYKHYPAVQAVFVRHAPAADVDHFNTSLALTQCDTRCRAERKASR